MSKFTTAIDFGSSKTAICVGQQLEDGVKVVFWKSAPSEGIRNGEINNITRCSKVLSILLEEASKAIGEPITEASVSISGRKLETRDISISQERTFPSSAISLNEIRTLTENQYKKSEEGRTILEVAPQQYNIDDQYNVEFDQLEGMRGKEFEADFKVISGKTSILENRVQVLKECDVKLKKAILSPIATARAVLSEQEREKGVVVIDFGKDLTEIAIVRNNVIREVYTLPFAGESISKDIACVTDISDNWAETLKVRHGYCLEEICPENKTLELTNEDGEVDSDVELLLLTRIIEARVSEILDAIKYIVKENKYAGKLTGGYVMTGGSAYLGYLLPLARTILGAKVRLAAPRGCISSDSENGAFDAWSAASVGVLLEHIDPMLSTSPVKKEERIIEPTVQTKKSKKKEKPQEIAERPVEKSDSGKKEPEFEELKVDDPSVIRNEVHERRFHWVFHRRESAKSEPKPTVEEKKEVKKPEKEVKKEKTLWDELFSDNGNGNNV